MGRYSRWLPPWTIWIWRLCWIPKPPSLITSALSIFPSRLCLETGNSQWTRTRRGRHHYLSQLKLGMLSQHTIVYNNRMKWTRDRTMGWPQRWRHWEVGSESGSCSVFITGISQVIWRMWQQRWMISGLWSSWGLWMSHWMNPIQKGWLLCRLQSQTTATNPWTSLRSCTLKKSRWTK